LGRGSRGAKRASGGVIRETMRHWRLLVKCPPDPLRILRASQQPHLPSYARIRTCLAWSCLMAPMAQVLLLALLSGAEAAVSTEQKPPVITLDLEGASNRASIIKYDLVRHHGTQFCLLVVVQRFSLSPAVSFICGLSELFLLAVHTTHLANYWSCVNT
jgi:hypothetical protein